MRSNLQLIRRAIKEPLVISLEVGMCNQYSPSDEFKTLREELLQAKKYVFERPLFIITVSIAALNFIEKPSASLLLPIAVGLLMFNLWFTLDRMHSHARIVAYIQLELEEKAYGPWLGWEICLRYHRIWMKSNKSDVKGIIGSKLETTVVPGAAGFYPTIYLMHVVAVAVTAGSSLAYAMTSRGVRDLAVAVITSLLSLLFAVYATKHRPGRLRNYIEESRIVWIEVFEDLQRRGIKTTSVES